jgi:2-succinyl-6-hydroxy-2,4-cyclohexadiene-1-carboxylate synthase
MCNQCLWQPAWQLLHQQCREDYQLVHLTIPSKGSMEEVVNELAAKVVAENPILVGFSLGGYIASAIALKLGSKLKHLLVISNFPKNLPDAEIKQRKRTIAWINQRGYSGIPNKRIDDLLHPDIEQFKSNRYLGIKHTIIKMDRECGVDVLLHQLGVSMQRPNLLPLLAQLSLPITFLVGDSDGLVDLAELENELFQRFNAEDNISLITVENTGHMLPLESPEAFTSSLINLITETKRTRKKLAKL